MKVEVDKDSVRIKGDICGKERHLKIYCSEYHGEDYYAISVIRDGMEIGVGTSFYMNNNHVIQTAGKVKTFID